MEGQSAERMGALIIGVIMIVIGMVLAGIIVDQAVTFGTKATIGSFAGVQALGDLIPLVFVTVVIGLGIGLMALSGAGFMGKGPMAR